MPFTSTDFAQQKLALPKAQNRFPNERHRSSNRTVLGWPSKTSVLNRMDCGVTTCASGKPVCSLILMKTPALV